MKKTIFKSTVYLIFISLIAKILSFVGRIILARKLSGDAMSYYTLASSTMIFAITLAQMGIPSALSKLIAQSDERRGPVLSSIIISVINNLVIVISFFFIIPFLAHTILKQDVIIPVLYAIVPLIPMVTISGILKGYLFGVQEHITAAGSQIYEEISRIIFLLLIFYLNPSLDAVTMAKIAMYSITIGEFFSSIYMYLKIKTKERNKRSILTRSSYESSSMHSLLSIALPMTGSRLIGSLTYFLEPIVMVIGLTTIQSSEMITAYGQLNGYVLPILTMPSFITVTLSNFLLPSFTYHFSRDHVKQAKKLFNMIIGCCSIIGIGCSFLCYTFPEELLQLFYHNSAGAAILKDLAIPFAFYSLQPPLSSMMHSLSKSNGAMIDTFVGSAIRILCVAFLSIQGATSLSIGLVAGMIVTTALHAIKVGIALSKQLK